MTAKRQGTSERDAAVLPAAFRSRLVGLCIAAGLALLAAGCGTDPDSEFANAQASIEAGDLRTASIHISNFLQARNDDAAGRVLRGRIALLNGDPVLARAELERARQLGGDDSAAVALAHAMIQTEDSVAALELLDGVSEAARDGDFWLVRAKALLDLVRLDEAADSLDFSENVGGETSGLVVARARLRNLRHEPERASELFDQAVELAERRHDRADALAARASHHLQYQRLEQAAADLEQALDLYRQDPVSPREAQMHAALLNAYLELDDLDGTERVAARLASRVRNAAITEFAAGIVAYRRGNYSEAAASLQMAANRAPEEPLFLTMLGATHLALGNVGQAEQQLRAAVAAAPTDVRAIKLLAETRLRRQRPEDALDALSVLPADLDDPQVDLLRGRAAMQSGNAARAVEYLEQAVGRNPGDQALTLELARMYLAAGREEEGGELLSSLSAGNEALRANLMSLAVHLQAGDVAAARAAAETLTTNHPEEARAQAAAGMFYQLTGDDTLAERSYRAAIAADETMVFPRLLLGSLLIRKERVSEAEMLLEETVALAPDDVLALASLAQLELEREEFSRAEALLTRAVASAPGALQIRYALGGVKLQLDQTNAAIALAQSLQQDFPQQPEGFLLDAEAGMVQERFGDAALRFGQAFELSPLWSILVREVTALSRAGRAGEAVPRLRSWLAERPRDFEARLMLADLLQAADRDSEAIAEYENLLLSDPDHVTALNNAAWLQRESDPDRALALVQRASARAPNHPAVLDTWGWILTLTGRVDEGILHLERANELSPNSEDIRYRLAFALASAGRSEEARNLLQALLTEFESFSTRRDAEELLSSL